MKCVQCGAEFSGNFCSNCGCPVTQTQSVVQQPVNVPQPVNIQQPMFMNGQMPYSYQQPFAQQKKSFPWWIFAIVAGVLLVALIGVITFFVLSGKDNYDDSESYFQEYGEDEHLDDDTPDIMASQGTLGDYEIEIVSAYSAEDYDMNPSLVVTYQFSNNSDTATSFDIALIATAYQDGFELEETFVFDDNACYTENGEKKIKPGKSIAVQKAYILKNEISSVEIEVTETFSLSDDKVIQTFTLN